MGINHYKDMKKKLTLLLLVLTTLLGCERSSNSVTINVHNKLPTSIEISYGKYPFNNGVHNNSILSGEIYQLTNEKDYNFFDVERCHISYPTKLIDTLSIRYNGLVSSNLMYNHEAFFECTPAKSNSSGNQIWTLIVDSLIFK